MHTWCVRNCELVSAVEFEVFLASDVVCIRDKKNAKSTVEKPIICR